MNIEKRTSTKILSVAVLVAGFLLAGPFAVYAATLNFSPSSGSYTVGSSITVAISVSSTDQAMNAASGVVSFPRDKLELTSLSKAASIFTLWVVEPSFSNDTGEATFEGVVPNPGFTGTTGKIITANFRVKAPGTALVSFSSGSVLANDGKGSDILTSLGSAQFTLSSAAFVPEAPEAPVVSSDVSTPSAPRISSPTHPSPEVWYSKKDAVFKWPLPPGVTGARVLVGSSPRTTPTVVYTPAIGGKEATDLSDGVLYFHAQLRNANGWGGVSHFRFQIDTEKPNRFDITEIPRRDLTEPRAAFTFDAHDALSGIDHYTVTIDGKGPATEWKDDGTHRYETPTLDPGKHTVDATALDKAGNGLTASAEFVVEALPSPTITEYPKELQSGETLIVRGIAVPTLSVTIWLKRENEEPANFVVQSDENGKFVFVSREGLREGSYFLWADVVDSRGARSLPTEKGRIVVGPLRFFRLGLGAVSVLSVLVPIVALLFLLFGVIWYGWHKFSLLRKHVLKEVREAEAMLHQVFDLLRESVRDQIRLLERASKKRQLTKEEEKVLKQLKKELNNAEKYIQREIEDIEKEVG